MCFFLFDVLTLLIGYTVCCFPVMWLMRLPSTAGVLELSSTVKAACLALKVEPCLR